MLRILLLLLVALPAASAQSAGIRWWSESFEEALERAAVRNVPLLVAFIQDDEEANDRLVLMLSDAQFVAATEGTVALIASPDSHKPKKEVYGGRTRGVCGKFGACTCGEHRAIERAARSLYWPTGLVKTPTIIVAKPDGEEIDRLVDVHPVSAYEAMIDRAARKLGRGLSRADYEKASKELAALRAALAADDVVAARRHVAELPELPATSALGSEIVAARVQIEERISGLVEEITTAAKGSDTVDALRKLRDLREDTGRTELGKRLARLERRITKTKAGREAERILEDEERIAENVTEAEQAVRSRDYVAAVRQWFIALDKARTDEKKAWVRERIAALEADETIRPVIAEELREGRAGAIYDDARILRRRDPARYREIMKEIIEKWPGTRAAEKAERALERL